MMFRLTHHDPLSAQLHHLLRQELGRALDRLAPSVPDETAVHEARVCVKKARALLRLARPALGRSYERENDRLRTAAHALAALRDADASLETLGLLAREFDAVLSRRVLAGVERGLRNRRRAVEAGAAPLLRTARQALGAAAATPRASARVDDAVVLARGVAVEYRRARKALAHLTLDASAAEFHGWRRRLKGHWYHMRLLEGLHSTPRRRATALRRLEGMLGDDHNLALLAALILTGPGCYGTGRSTALVLGCIAKKQQHLRTDALALGRRLYTGRPRDFRRDVARWWRGR